MSKTSALLPLKIATNELLHGWRHFSVFLACLVLGVTVIASVNTLGAVVKQSLNDEAQSLLGGDVEVSIRGVQASDEQRAFLAQYGDVSYVATLRAMLQRGEEGTLVEIKAVDAYYPLIGSLSFNQSITKSQALVDNGVAVDAILLAQLDLAIGDEIAIGKGRYVIQATIASEPDRAVQLFSFGPRVMMSHASLAQSDLISTFSLVSHRYRINTSGDQPVGQAFEDSLEQTLQTRFPDVSWRVSTGTDGNLTLKRFLDQLLAFLTLSGLATFLIAGIGIGSSVRAYLEKKSHTIAVLKVQGAPQHMVLIIYVSVVGLLALAGGIMGMALALVLTTQAVPLLAQILPSVGQSAGVHWPSSVVALWFGVLITFLFSMPSILSAMKVKPSVLFRSKVAMLQFSRDRLTIMVVIVLIVALANMMLMISEDKGFIGGALVVIMLAFGLFWLCVRVVRLVAKKIKVRTPWLKLAIGNMHRPGSTTGTVVYAVGISLMVLIALTLTEANFQARINQLLQERAPSLFMIDIQPHQKQEIEALLLRYAPPERVMLYPMVRGRIVKLAGEPVVESKVDDDVRWAVRGDRGLSYSVLPPANANIIKGQWWPEDYQGAPQLSVDKRFLNGMGVDIGDTMTVRVLGEEITATITSAREIDYSTFQLNFAMMFSPGVIEQFPFTSLATIHLDSDDNKERELIRAMAKNHPQVTVIRTREVVELVQAVMKNIAIALRVTVAISIFAGLLVLTSALGATIEQRMYDIAVLKVLGASRGDVLKCCSAEWIGVALITSVIAIGMGTVSAWLINDRFRAPEFSAMPHLSLAIVLLCVVVIWLIGYVGNRRLFNFRPAGLLRNE